MHLIKSMSNFVCSLVIMKGISWRVYAFLTMALVLVAGNVYVTQVILTSGSSWTVLSDWNNFNNIIEVIDSGAKTGFDRKGDGDGNGGIYSIVDNQALFGTICYLVGVAGLEQGGSVGIMNLGGARGTGKNYSHGAKLCHRKDRAATFLLNI